ncbi:MAG TPA: hypothetical protein O0X39_04155 [Methanocorpusculum sp.]|nr:hypothetical protein [Methanocorpusculum sp.]
MTAKDIKKTENVCFRITEELQKKVKIICETENKTFSSVIHDAINLYANLYPMLHALKSKKLYPSLIINEETIKDEIYNSLKKLI